MHSFDEASLRKAASWQDFKEAQSILCAGAVLSSEETADGWQGTIKAGGKTYRTSVVARTPTWFDAKCPCPANQRGGNFCPHAIAIGLHLLNPPEIKPRTENRPTATPIPQFSWDIRLLGPWQTGVRKGRLSVSLTRSESPASEADSKLTAWLIAQKVVSRPPIQLSLSQENLPSFLFCIETHPNVSSDTGQLSIDSGAQLLLDDCTLACETVTLKPSPQEIVRIGASLWKISPNEIAEIGSGNIPPTTTAILRTLADGKPAQFPIAEFLDSLDSLQSLIDFSSSAWFGSLQFIPALPDFELNITGSDSAIYAKLTASYARSDLPSLEGFSVLTRNPIAEAAARSISPLIDGKFSSSDPDAIRTFLTRSLGSFPPSWKRKLSPAILKLASSCVFISPKIEILSSGEDWLDFDLKFETESGLPVPAEEIRRLLRSKGSSSQHHRPILSEDIENLIDPLFESLDIRQENGRFTAKSASAHIIRGISNKIRNNQFLNDQELLLEPRIPTSLQADLRPYQAHGFRWMNDCLSRYSGVLLADDMGLGKTLQTIAYVEHLFATCSHPAPALVVVTTSLLGNWEAEFGRFAPSRRVVILHGPDRDKLRESIGPQDVVVTTYATLARDLAWHLRQSYSVAVIDEASLIRNPDTDHSKAVARLNAANRIALTGTPVENSATDLWAIFRFIQPGWLGTRADFKERYETPLSSPETAPRTGILLRLKTSPFVLRRTKSEVAPELPSKIQIDDFCDLSPDQAATYRTLIEEGRKRIGEIRDSGQEAAARMQTLTTLLLLRQTCCDLALLDSERLRALPLPRRSAKLERLLDITTQSIAAGSKLLVFSQFRTQLLAIGSALDAHGISSLRLDGQTRNRSELVDRFQSPSGPPVFLISLKAGGYGLNLTAADVVVHFDPWWNPAAEAQATDRAHRIGQTKPVTVHRLLARGTVEEKVVHLQSRKRALADSLDESSAHATDIPSLSSAELERLLVD